MTHLHAHNIDAAAVCRADQVGHALQQSVALFQHWCRRRQDDAVLDQADADSPRRAQVLDSRVEPIALQLGVQTSHGVGR